MVPPFFRNLLTQIASGRQRRKTINARTRKHLLKVQCFIPRCVTFVQSSLAPTVMSLKVKSNVVFLAYFLFVQLILKSYDDGRPYASALSVNRKLRLEKKNAPYPKIG